MKEIPLSIHHFISFFCPGLIINSIVLFKMHNWNMTALNDFLIHETSTAAAIFFLVLCFITGILFDVFRSGVIEFLLEKLFSLVGAQSLIINWNFFYDAKQKDKIGLIYSQCYSYYIFEFNAFLICLILWFGDILTYFDFFGAYFIHPLNIIKILSGLLFFDLIFMRKLLVKATTQ